MKISNLALDASSELPIMRASLDTGCTPNGVLVKVSNKRSG